MDHKIMRELRILKTYALVSILLFAALFFLGMKQNASPTK